jgi:hypothetical protein
MFLAAIKTEIGGTRVLDVMFGEQLPRICSAHSVVANTEPSAASRFAFT